MIYISIMVYLCMYKKKCAFKKEIKRKENPFRYFLKKVYNNGADNLLQ